MKCKKCEGRWVALMIGSTHGGGRSSYHFESDSLNCPRCGAVGSVDEDVLMEHQRHPNVVATMHAGSARRGPP